jgi:hypothetical protein
MRRFWYHMYMAFVYRDMFRYSVRVKYIVSVLICCITYRFMIDKHSNFISSFHQICLSYNTSISITLDVVSMDEHKA